LILVVSSAVALAQDAPTTEPAEPTESSAGTTSAGSSGNVQFLLGQTYLHDFWQPLDEPLSFGVEVDFAPKSSPVHVALGAHAFAETQHVSAPYFDRRGSVGAGFVELSAGFLWLPVKHGVVRPYLGAGGLTLLAAVGGGSDWWNGDRDVSFGFYANAGVFFKIGSSFNIGFDGRLVRGTDITLEGRDGDADYGQGSVLMGFSWGH